MDLEGKLWDGVDWIHLNQATGQGLVVINTLMNFWVS
jgi:hypothetical protein